MKDNPPNENEIAKGPQEMREGEWHKLDESLPDDPPETIEDEEWDI